MIWKKAGRPRVRDPVVLEDEPWTKEELTLKNGVLDLAKAVVQRWKQDGSPEKDLPYVTLWMHVIQELSHYEDDKLGGFVAGKSDDKDAGFS